MCLKIILKVTKNQRFTLSLEDTFFEKPHGWGQIDHTLPPSRFRIKVFATDVRVYCLLKVFYFIQGRNVTVKKIIKRLFLYYRDEIGISLM